jgi:hypothetical protein
MSADMPNAVSAEMPNTVSEYQEQAVEGERGALVAVLVMVLLGLAGIFAVS